MYQLGGIQFEGVRGLSGLKKTREAVYAEMPLIGGKPRLQRTGTALQQVSIGISLHASFTDPVADIAALDAYREAGEVLALITGEGEVIGNFIISTIDETVIQTSPTGRTISAEISLSLKEYHDPNAAATQKKEAVNAAFAVGSDNVVPVRLVRPPITSMSVVSQKVTGGISASAAGISEVRSVPLNPAQQVSAFARAKKLLEQAKQLLDAAKEAVNLYDNISAKAPQLMAQIAAVGANIDALVTFVSSGDTTNALTACDTLEASFAGLQSALRPINTILITRQPQ